MRHLLLAALVLLLAVPVSASSGLTFLDETYLPTGTGTSTPDQATMPLPSGARAAAQDELAATLQSLTTMLGTMMAELRRRDEIITGLMTLVLRALPGAMPATAPCLPGMACPPSSRAPLSAAALTPGCGSMASACRSLSRGCPSGRPSCLAAAPRVVRSCGR